MDLVLVFLILVLLFGCGIGYTQGGPVFGGGIIGVLLIVLVIYLLFGR